MCVVVTRRLALQHPIRRRRLTASRSSGSVLFYSVLSRSVLFCLACSARPYSILAWPILDSVVIRSGPARVRFETFDAQECRRFDVMLPLSTGPVSPAGSEVRRNPLPHRLWRRRLRGGGRPTHMTTCRPAEGPPRRALPAIAARLARSLSASYSPLLPALRLDGIYFAAKWKSNSRAILNPDSSSDR